jgi:two-component system cell cycle sensor histidine kinase/response regulator CckA
MSTPAEDALRESNERFQAAFQASPIAMVISRAADGVYVDVNPAALAMFGYTREEAIGTSALAMNLWVSADERAELIAELRRDGEVNARAIRVRHKDGHELNCVTSVRPLMLSGVAHLLFISEDVTKRRALETQLLQAQKLEAVGRLAGGVAHDFNNLLTIVMGAVRELQEETALSPGGRAAAEEIKQATERAGALTRQLLAFSRKHIVHAEVLELNDVVAGLSRMLARLIGEDIELLVTAGAHAGRVRMDGGQLEQVIVNLAVNARDAMPRGGRLSITTAPAPAAPGPSGESAPGVLLTVADTGCGMTPEVQARLFEPFFTTKPLHGGTGLGLSTAYGIVTQAGGRISVTSAVDRGSTFEVWLPAVADKVGTDPPPVGRALAQGRGTVLLVEDEPALLKLCARALRSAGYTVLEAASGEGALALLSTREVDLAALVVDIVMPGINGIELARRLRAGRPGLRVLYMSGYTHQAEFPPVDGSWTFLQKPFDPVGFTRALRELIEGAST